MNALKYRNSVLRDTILTGGRKSFHEEEYWAVISRRNSSYLGKHGKTSCTWEVMHLGRSTTHLLKDLKKANMAVAQSQIESKCMMRIEREAGDKIHAALWAIFTRVCTFILRTKGCHWKDGASFMTQLLLC